MGRYFSKSHTVAEKKWRAYVKRDLETNSIRPFRLKRSALSVKNEESYTFCKLYNFKYSDTISEKLAQWVQGQ